MNSVHPDALNEALEGLRDYPKTKTGRPAFVTRKRRPRRQRPRIAGRFVRRHSIALTLDWDLSPPARLCLLFLLSLPRDGLYIHAVYAKAIATQFGVVPNTVRTWLRALEAEEYLTIRPGQLRGAMVILLRQKAARWTRRSPNEKRKPSRGKTAKPSNPPHSGASATNSRPIKGEERKQTTEAAPAPTRGAGQPEEGLGKEAAGGVWRPSAELQAITKARERLLAEKRRR